MTSDRTNCIGICYCVYLCIINCVYLVDDTDINANNTNEDKRPTYFQDSHHISMHEPSTTELVPLAIYSSETDLQYTSEHYL